MAGLENHDIIKFYPCYIDSNCKVNEGRKIAKELAIPDASAEEIYNVLTQLLKFKCTPEYKHHAQDWMKRGRILVNLKDKGVPINNIITKKSQLIKAVAEILSKIRLQNKEKKQIEDLEEVGNGKKKKNKKNK